MPGELRIHEVRKMNDLAYIGQILQTQNVFPNGTGPHTGKLFDGLIGTV